MKYLIWGMAGLLLAGQMAGLIIYHMPGKQAKAPQPPSGRETAMPQEQPLLAEETIDYSLQNDELNITFDKGQSWVGVPIKKEALFGGEYSGNQQELIKDSYILTEEFAAFLYSEGDRPESNQIKLMFSSDQGKTWQEAVVAEQYPPIRFRKVGFLSSQFGYVIISGDRTMSQEASSVFLTHDGGKTWAETNPSNVTRLVADGGFVDEQTGFISYGILNPEKPDLLVTQDGGSTWSEAGIRIPEEYHQIFVIAETPFKEGDQLAMLVNQGPSGDYKGRKVKGKFISADNGKTWEFAEEVQSDE